MKKLIFYTLLFLSSSITFAGNYTTIQVDQYENTHPSTLMLDVDFADNIIISEDHLKLLKSNKIVKIELIYTQFKRNQNFDQTALNISRIKNFKKKFPDIDLENVEWIFIEQTQAQDYYTAQNYFHGFVVHYEKTKNSDPLPLECEVFDALMGIKVDLPPVIDSLSFDKVCLEQFNSLARKTNGEVKLVARASEVSETIAQIVNQVAKPELDLMIILDNTGSMQDDIADIKKGLAQIINSIKNIEGARLSLATYADKNVKGTKWYSFENFETDLDYAIEYINDITTTGGGDFPESVYDGIYETFYEDFWRSNSKRVAILIGDAPGLDNNRSDHSEKDIVKLANRSGIKMNFYPIVISPNNTMAIPSQPDNPSEFVSSVYPNPTQGEFFIETDFQYGLSVEIFDQSGKLILRDQLTDSKQAFNISNNRPGLYIIRVYDGKKNYDIKKVILR